MTDRSRQLVLIALAIVSVNAGAAEPPPMDTRTGERVAPHGPYRSRVRVLDSAESKAPVQPSEEALLAATQGDAYARALLLRQLAHRRVESGDNAAAIAYFEEAIALGSLAGLAQTQIQLNLGQLYAAAGRYREALPYLEAATTDIANPSPDLLITLAGVYLLVERHAEAAAAALRAIDAATEPPADWFAIAMQALYDARRYAAGVTLGKRRLARWPTDAEAWRQLAAMHHAAGNRDHALAVSEVAAVAGLLDEPEGYLQLVDQRRENGLPDGAALLLEQLIGQQRIATDSAQYQRLAAAWLDARNYPAAMTALERSATLDDNAATWLQLGEIATEFGDWDMAARALTRASGRRADGATRARALLLLGQARYYRGEHNSARAAFEQASEYGGVSTSATQWLDFLAAAPPPPTLALLPDEREPQAPDAPVPTVVDDATAGPPAPAATPSPDRGSDLTIKTVPGMRVYALSETTQVAELGATVRELVTELQRATRRDRLEWTGPLHLFYRGTALDPQAQIEVEAGAPVRRGAPPRGRLRARSTESFRCVWQRYEGPLEGVTGAWQALFTDLLAAGHTASGETRHVVLHAGGPGTTSIVELQIGIL